MDTANQTARVLGEQSYNQITQFITSEDLDLPNFEAAVSPMAASTAPRVAAATEEVAASSASDVDALAADAGGGHAASTSHTDAARSQPDRAAAGIDGGSAEAKYDDYPNGDAPNDTPVAPAPKIFVFVPSPAPPESIEPVAPSEAASAAVEVSSAASTSVTVPCAIANKSQGMEQATMLDDNCRKNCWTAFSHRNSTLALP